MFCRRLDASQPPSHSPFVNVDVRIERLDLRQVNPGIPFEDVLICPVCDSPEGTDLVALERSLTTRACARCGHLFRSRRPSAEWYRAWYGSSWDVGDESLPARRVALDVARMGLVAHNPKSGMAATVAFCRPAARRGARVLDVGCGYGPLLHAFRRAGCSVHGIEPSPYRARVARALGARIASIGIEDLAPETFGDQFDLVTTSHVLEHILEPQRYFDRVRAVTRPGGFVYIAVPNAGTDFLLQHAFYALHVHLFTRRSLETALRRAGFEPQRVAEDHQLRILARRTATATPTSGDAAIPLDAACVHERLLGPGWQERAGREVFCKWSLLEPWRMLREPYAVEYAEQSEPPGDRSVALRATGEPELPVRLRTRETDGATAFWAK